MHDEEIIRFIQQFITQRGYSPTLQEIGDAGGFSIKTAHKRIHRLVNSGHVKIDIRRGRTIRLSQGENDDRNPRGSTEASSTGRPDVFFVDRNGRFRDALAQG